MTPRPGPDPDYGRSLRQLLTGVLVVLFIALFAVWRIDNARVESLRMTIVDRFMPSFDWTTRPIAATVRMVSDFRAYRRVYEQNDELRRELQRMEGWREVALQLEQKNARLLALNNVRLNPRLTYITAEVMADAGSPFRRSAMLNVGRADGVEDGFPVVDGLGLVGRIAGTAERSSRVIFLSDGSSRVPGTVLPSGQRVLVSGDNGQAPVLEFLEEMDEISAGDRVVTSGDGGLFPPDIPVGRVMMSPDGRIRLNPAADHRRLDFVRVLRRSPAPEITGPGAVIGPLTAREASAAQVRP